MILNKTSLPKGRLCSYAFIHGNVCSYNKNIVEPVYSGHHRNLKKMSAIESCPLHRGFAQIGTFTSSSCS